MHQRDKNPGSKHFGTGSRSHSFDIIIRDYYPDLQIEDIKACIQHAIDVVEIEDIHVSAAS